MHRVNYAQPNSEFVLLFIDPCLRLSCILIEYRYALLCIDIEFVYLGIANASVSGKTSTVENKPFLAETCWQMHSF